MRWWVLLVFLAIILESVLSKNILQSAIDNFLKQYNPLKLLSNARFHETRRNPKVIRTTRHHRRPAKVNTYRPKLFPKIKSLETIDAQVHNSINKHIKSHENKAVQKSPWKPVITNLKRKPKKNSFEKVTKKPFKKVYTFEKELEKQISKLNIPSHISVQNSIENGSLLNQKLLAGPEHIKVYKKLTLSTLEQQEIQGLTLSSLELKDLTKSGPLHFKSSNSVHQPIQSQRLHSMKSLHIDEQQKRKFENSSLKQQSIYYPPQTTLSSSSSGSQPFHNNLPQVMSSNPGNLYFNEQLTFSTFEQQHLPEKPKSTFSIIKSGEEPPRLGNVDSPLFLSTISRTPTPNEKTKSLPTLFNTLNPEPPMINQIATQPTLKEEQNVDSPLFLSGISRIIATPTPEENTKSFPTLFNTRNPEPPMFNKNSHTDQNETETQSGSWKS
jgi:hypothetical protein